MTCQVVRKVQDGGDGHWTRQETVEEGSRYISEVEPVGFPGGLLVGKEGKRGRWQDFLPYV